MHEVIRVIRLSAAREIWPLLLFIATLTGCTSGPPTRYTQVPSGAVAYPSDSYYFGPFAYHRLYSILPGSAQLQCLTRVSVVAGNLPRVEVASCFPASEEGMKEVADSIARAFLFMEQASPGSMRYCQISVGLVGYNIGIHAKDIQSLHNPCARLKMVARWEPTLSASLKRAAIRSIVRNTAHEAYHVTLRRRGQRERHRLKEETEAIVVELCAANVALGADHFNTIEQAYRPSADSVGQHYLESLAGDKEARIAISNGSVRALARAAPAGFSRDILTACAEVLSTS